MDEQCYTIEAIIPVDANENDILERAASLQYLADFGTAEVLVGEAKKGDFACFLRPNLRAFPAREQRPLLTEWRYGWAVRSFLLRSALPYRFRRRSDTGAFPCGKTVIVVLSGEVFPARLYSLFPRSKND